MGKTRGHRDRGTKADRHTLLVALPDSIMGRARAKQSGGVPAAKPAAKPAARPEPKPKRGLLALASDANRRAGPPQSPAAASPLEQPAGDEVRATSAKQPSVLRMLAQARVASPSIDRPEAEAPRSSEQDMTSAEAKTRARKPRKKAAAVADQVGKSEEEGEKHEQASEEGAKQQPAKRQRRAPRLSAEAGIGSRSSGSKPCAGKSAAAAQCAPLVESEEGVAAAESAAPLSPPLLQQPTVPAESASSRSGHGSLLSLLGSLQGLDMATSSRTEVGRIALEFLVPPSFLGSVSPQGVRLPPLTVERVLVGATTTPRA